MKPTAKEAYQGHADYNRTHEGGINPAPTEEPEDACPTCGGEELVTIGQGDDLHEVGCPDCTADPQGVRL